MPMQQSTRQVAAEARRCAVNARGLGLPSRVWGRLGFRGFSYRLVLLLLSLLLLLLLFEVGSHASRWDGYAVFCISG